MKRFITYVLTLCFYTLSLVHGENETLPQTEEQRNIGDKQLFQFYENIPQKVYRNEVFSIKVKSLVPTEQFTDLYSSLSNALNVQIMNAKPKWVKIDNTTYSLTLYLKAKGEQSLTPTIQTILEWGEGQNISSTLQGMQIATNSVNANSSWCRVLGRSLAVIGYKIDHYDQNNNIIVLEIDGTLANMEDFNLPMATKQGVDSINGGLPNTKMYYYAVIPNTLKLLEFSYFNTASERFTPVKVDIDLSKIDENKVSTQSDINPRDDNKLLLKAAFLLFIAVGFGGLYYFKRNPFFFLPVGFSIIMLIALFIPEDKVILKPGADVTILPTTVSTVFYKNAAETKVKKIKEVDGYIKIIFDDGRVGWVKKDFVR